MRLLNTTTLELGTFTRRCPEYTILSHTWGDQEAPLEVFLPRPRWQRAAAWLRKRRYPKVVGACRLAKSQGYDWIWIDTCCIDKSSSTELSEAINSMYGYYEKSAVCFAYLVDVGVDVSSPKQELADALVHSRWFTRGWTLQELIAPSSVEFYNKEWALIGNKTSLSSHLEKITSIPAGLFSPAWYNLCAGGMARQSLRLLSVAQKLSWASTRQTTRPEDLAYCLMGLFDVHMPLLYGEGETKAFTRLQAEIARQANDQSLFAWGVWYDEATGRGRSSVLCYSLYAPHPSCFAGLGDIRTSYSRLVSILDHWAPPFETPNDGYLRIKMRVCPNDDQGAMGFMDDDHIAFLECELHGTTDMVVGLFVKRLEDVNGIKRFIRVRRLLGRFPKASALRCGMEDILLGALPRHIPRFNFLGTT
jgi:hypothetical protein